MNISTRSRTPVKIKNICMLSSASLGIIALFFSGADPISKFFGFSATVLTQIKELTSKKDDLWDEFAKATDSAWKSTRYRLTDSMIRIWEELDNDNDFFSKLMCNDYLNEDKNINLPVIIQSTEQYRVQYCTNKDAREMIGIFENELVKAISKYPALSQFYSLSIAYSTHDKIQQLIDLVENNTIEIGKMSKSVSDVHQKFNKLENICNKCFSDIIFIIISTAIFFIIGTIIFEGYNELVTFTVPVCYIISDVLIFFLRQELNMDNLIDRYLKNYPQKKKDKFIKYVLPAILSTCGLIIVYCTINPDMVELLQSICGLTVGCWSGKALKEVLKKETHLIDDSKNSDIYMEMQK